MNRLKLIIIFIAIILFGLVNTESVIWASQGIDIKYITSYSAKSMGGVIPLKIYFDRQQNELYIGSQSKEIAVINEDGMIVHRIPLADSPKLLCVNKNGNIYISDNKGGISILNYRGEYIKNLDLSAVPDNTLLAIQSFHVDENEHLYIGDGRLSRIIVLDSSGNFLYQFGKKGSGEGEFLNAKAITTDAERLYLIDPPLFRVSVYDKKDGRFLYMFGQISSLFGGFSMPSSIDTDGKRLFVVDTNRAMVIVFDREGKPIIEFGGVGRNPDSLSWPSDIKVDGNGKIYVCDTGNGRIQIYELIDVQQIDEVKPPETVESGKAAEPIEVEPVIEKIIVK
ncbi:MAG: 6-bladed beta-propeller [Nitrospinae bacterium]|nr:6-bladed beta-propeller [Nitrospinota bacterium]